MAGSSILPASQINALSISRHAQAIVSRPSHHCHVIGHFRHVVNLLISPVADSPCVPVADPPLIALVTPEIGNGPFHIVVTALPPTPPGPAPIRLHSGALHLGHWTLKGYLDAPLWDPAPCWAAMAVSATQVTKLQKRVSAERSLQPPGSTAETRTSHLLASGLDHLLQALQQGDATGLSSAAAALAGLGRGLTPEGDDILAGAMLALFAAHHPDAARLSASLLTAAGPRTTLLSRAFLAAASRGEATAPWHQLMAALSGAARGRGAAAPSGTVALDEAVGRVLAFGATSGLSMLFGFVSAYAQVRRTP